MLNHKSILILGLLIIIGAISFNLIKKITNKIYSFYIGISLKFRTLSQLSEELQKSKDLHRQFTNILCSDKEYDEINKIISNLLARNNFKNMERFHLYNLEVIKEYNKKLDQINKKI